MRVVVAPDKFAGTLTAREAAAAIAAGWLRVRPADDVDRVPLADGGPGFLDVLHDALGGQVVGCQVPGPLGGGTPAAVLVVEGTDGRSAYVEAAQACGLELVRRPSSRTALEATTGGVADLLRAALDRRPQRVVVGVGGTATTDGGRACVERFGGVGAWPEDVELVVATDVTAPLLGAAGAVAVFGPQKGAGPQDLRTLEERLEEWARVTGGPVDRPGAGAGGGLGYGLLLLGGRVEAGLASVLAAVGLAERLARADLVVTGEGRLDSSSLTGKVAAGVAAAARAAGVRCVVLAGDRAEGVSADRLAAAGVDEVRTLVAAFGRDAALRRPADRLAQLAAGLAGDQA